MPRTGHRGRSAIVAITLAFLSLGSSLPFPVAAAAPTFAACAQVVNVAGWGVSQATVTFTGLSTKASTSDTTDADGHFEIPGLPSDQSYVVTIQPGASTPVYAPWSSLTTQAPFFDPSERPATTCQPSGNPGLRLDDGTITLASPGQGFVEVHVVDAARGDALPFSGATVATNLASATTGASGSVRLPCALGDATTVTVVSTTQPTLYLPSARADVPCRDANPETLSINFWRKPVEIAFVVTDASTRTTTAGVTTEDPVQHVGIVITRTPADLEPLNYDWNTDHCGGGDSAIDAEGFEYDLQVNVSTDDRSPYHCAHDTDEQGTATLLVPWADAGAGSYRFETNGGNAYLPASREVSVTKDDATRAAATTATAPGGPILPAASKQTPHVANKYERFALRPSTVVYPLITGTVTDYLGNEIPNADVRFDGPTSAQTTTGPDGEFGVHLAPTVVPETYTITLTIAGFNVRRCTATVDTVGTLTITKTNSDTSDYCFKLIPLGKGAIVGTATDPLTSLPIPGIQFCANAVCNSTNSTGGYTLEAPAPATVSLTPTDWTVAAAATVQLDQIVSYPPALTRTTTTISFVAKDSVSGDPIASAIMCVTGPASVIPATSTCDAGGQTTAASGNPPAFTIASVPWTKRAGDATFDLGGIQVVRSGRHALNPHYANATAGPFYVMNDTPNPQFDVTLQEEGTKSSTITVVDEHTGASITDAAIAVSASSVSCGPGTCTGTSGSPISLYSNTDPDETEHSYSAQASKANYVQNGTSTNFAPGAPVTINLSRTSSLAIVQVFDAHTGGPIQGATVAVAGSGGNAFDCLATGAPANFARVCAGTTLANGTATPDTPGPTATTGVKMLSVPWTTTPNEECFVIPAGAYTVGNVNVTRGHQIVFNAHVSGDAAAVRETVDFQASETCFILGPGETKTFKIYLTRATSQLAGTVTDFAGNDLAGALVTAASERAYPFTCDPSGTFPDCGDGDDTDANGAFSLTLPKVAKSTTGAATPRGVATPGAPVPDDTWGLTVEKTGYHTARFPLVTPGATPPLQVWPATFTATVTFSEQDSATCGDSLAEDVLVTLLDIEAGIEYEATAQKGATCSATFTGVGWDRYLHDSLHTEPIAKTTNHFLVNTSYGSYAGAFAAPLGPDETTVDFTTFNGSTPTVNEQIRPGYVTGKISDRDGKQGAGAANVSVSVTRQGTPCAANQLAGQPKVTTTTAAGGLYAVPITCAGTFLVEVSSPSYQTTAPKTVTFATSNPTADFDLDRVTRTLTVTVQDGTSTPEGVPVGIAPIDAQESAKSVQGPVPTDAEGQVVFSNVPWGAYTVTTAPPSGSGTGATTVAIVRPEQDATATGLVVRPPPVTAGVIAGTLQDLDGSPVLGAAGVTVTVTREGNPCPANQLANQPETIVVSAPTGAYRAPVACAGTFKVVVSSPAYQAEDPKFGVVEAGATTPVVDFALSRVTSALTVTVQNGTVAQPGILVEAKSTERGSLEGTATTGPDGKATFENVPWGAYEVVTKPAPEAGKGQTTAALVLPGMPASAFGLIVFQPTPPTPGEPITGRVLDDDAAMTVGFTVDSTPVQTANPTQGGVPGVLVTATKTGESCLEDAPSAFSAVTDATGGYEIAMPQTCAGDYTITFTHPSAGTPRPLYEAADALSVTYDPATGLADADAHFDRTGARLSMWPVNLTREATNSQGTNTVSNTVIDPQPVDVTTNPQAQTFTQMQVNWNLPWGFYFVVPKGPASSPTTDPEQGTYWGVPQLVLLHPGATDLKECYVVYVPRSNEV